MRALALLAAGVFVAAAPARAADTYYMTDGDRVSGKTLAEVQGFYKVDTPYGKISIPKGRVARIVHEDGREEILSAVVERTPPLPPSVKLVLVFTGTSFWQAWSGKDTAPADPSLRLEVRLDEETVGDFVDSKTDSDIPGAVVNTFSFAPGDLSVQPGGRARLEAPDVRPGRISLKADLPLDLAGDHALHLAYQMNDGSSTSPTWRTLVEAGLRIKLKQEAPAVVEVHQDRGGMEFSGLFKKKMKNVETFRVELKAGGS